MKLKKSDHEKLIKAFFQGAREALSTYAQEQNGVKYVSYSKTLQQAIDELNNEEVEALIAIKEKLKEQK